MTRPDWWEAEEKKRKALVERAAQLKADLHITSDETSAAEAYIRGYNDGYGDGLEAMHEDNKK